jgi:hypothetical protein
MRLKITIPSILCLVSTVVLLGTACGSESGSAGVPDGAPAYVGVISRMAGTSGERWLLKKDGDECGTAIGRGPSTRVLREQAEGPPKEIRWDELTPGREAAAWFDGDEGASCPGAARAETVLEYTADR